MRVLIALYTFRNKSTETAQPTREAISERTGMAQHKISKATSDLERLGWITKVGNGGRSMATTYRVHVPETLTNSGTVYEAETVPEQDTVLTVETVPDSVTVPYSVTVPDSAQNPTLLGCETLPYSGRGKEQTVQTIQREGAPARPAKKPSVTFDAWLLKVESAGQQAIPETDTVFSYAEAIGLPVEFLRLAWLEFKRRYTGNDKRYQDWQAVFRNAVRNNWFKLWFANNDGGFSLTTQGVQAQRAMQAEAA